MLWCGVLLHLLLLACTDATRLTGTFRYRDVDHDPTVFLAKFGVKKGHTFSMYGNASSIKYNGNEYYTSVYLAFTPSKMWEEMKNKGKHHGLSNKSCNNTYYEILEKPCKTNVLDTQSYIRTMPCHHRGPGLCYQPLLLPPPPDALFLFHYDSAGETDFWYAYFVVCSQNRSHDETCDWYESDNIEFSYDYSIVYSSYHNPDQVPANYEGLLPFYSVFTGLYVLLISFHFVFNSPCCMRKEQRVHLLVWLYAVAMVLEALNIVCALVHYSVYTHNGVGVPQLVYIKDALNIVADWVLIVILVLVAGGWQVTLKRVKWKYASFGFCALYIGFTIVYYVGEVVYMKNYPWNTLDPLQQWTGILYLIARGLLVVYVWYQLYHIYQQEEDFKKLRLYRILAILFTIWFWYLPLLIILSPAINHVFITIVIATTTTIMNFVVNLILAMLFCPKWSGDYFQFDSTGDYTVIKDSKGFKLKGFFEREGSTTRVL